MPHQILTDRFQITLSAKEEAGEKWAEAETVRKDYAVRRPEELPTLGSEAPVTTDRQMPLTTMGETDPTNCVTADALRRGFTKGEMVMTDELAGDGEEFFSDAGGFVERRNVLDRN